MRAVNATAELKRLRDAAELFVRSIDQDVAAMDATRVARASATTGRTLYALLTAAAGVAKLLEPEAPTKPRRLPIVPRRRGRRGTL